MNSNKRHIFVLGAALVAITSAQIVFGHVTVSPREAQAGAEQVYSMRVPTERDTPTIRVEIEFPAEVEVLEVSPKAGWEIEVSVSREGRIIGAVWTGSSIPPREAQEFEFLARNPTAVTTLVWRAIQVHEDGSRAEWIGESGSRTPAPMTRINAEQ